MNNKLLLLALLSVQASIYAITIYPPFSDSPCQTTYGPGSYGKTCSDVRYRDGWSWKPKAKSCCKR